jgi:hypothetical protein
MSLFNIKKAAMNEMQHEQNQPKDKNPKRDEFLKKLKKDSRIADLQNKHEHIGDKELLDAAKQAKQELGANTTKDLIISKMIDNLVKGVDKGDKKNLAKQGVDEAVAKLQATGITAITSSTQQIDNKKVLEEHKVANPNAELKR